MKLEIATVPSPIGSVTFAVKDSTLCAMTFSDAWPQQLPRLQRRFSGVELRQTVDPARIATRLRRYFDGDITALDDIGVDPGGTPFQQRVWNVLGSIRPGSILSYRSVAEAVGKPTAVRAVGAANGSNPIAIVIPCHRVIAADGTLCGYGGGLERKRWLLLHEGVPLSESKGQPENRSATLF
ncbi:MAG: methylated-DNA--[protein]-cysteine S-methyltransferase [Deltaproteobacteria bacterium]|nr:methylated-DNA--[protein]-cysteine S-methyltransferase [Deltaproteobacteria bacterium]